MREDLEVAMGVALTSRSACQCLLDEPSEFLELFELDEHETHLLRDMANDLAALMPGFVVKRERSLRRALQLSLELLGDLGSGFIAGYCDAHPEVETMMPELVAFADFLIEETRLAADSIDFGAIIVDSARFERLRLLSFGTPGPLWPQTASGKGTAASLHQQMVLSVHPSARWDRFGWDLRSLRSRDDLWRMRVDPCVLLYFRWGAHGAQQAIRLDEETARAVDFLGGHPGTLSAADLCQEIGTERSPERLLGKLVTYGIVQGGDP
jgi:hypothetical protein